MDLLHFAICQTILLQKREKLLPNTASSFTKSSSKNTHKHSGKNCYFRSESGPRTCLEFFREMYGNFYTEKLSQTGSTKLIFLERTCCALNFDLYTVMTKCNIYMPSGTILGLPQKRERFIGISHSFSSQSQENSNVYYVERK